jgi:3-oxoacyl-[acyl-carrier protein] reductase
VAVLDVDERAALAVADELGGLGLLCDVTSAASVDQAFRTIRDELGLVSILVNNAGITGRTVPLWELEERDLDAVYAVNLKGVFLCCQAVISAMMQGGYGRILNVASIAGKEGNPTMIPYSSTKAGVIALTKALAKEVAGKGDITVNCISPAVIQTQILDSVAAETVRYMVSRIPLGRTGTIDEVASLVQFLVSREASFTTGQCYDISGGRATY